MQRVSVGDVEVVALIDMVSPSNAARVYAETADRLGEYQDLLDDAGNVVLTYSCYLLRADGRTVLVDTGNGPESQGKLLDELATAGVRPDEIDVVVFTHLHGDHTGFNLERGSGALTFPKARYLVPREDWDHARTQQPPPRSFTRDVAPLEALGAMDPIDGEIACSPSIRSIAPSASRGATSRVKEFGGGCWAR